MYIKHIINQNKSDQEADVYITDDQYDILCYVYSSDKIYTSQVIECLYGFMCSHIMVSDVKEFDVIKLEQYYSYRVTAIVTSAKESIVRVGNIRIKLDTELPGDIGSGEYVQFTAKRFDVVI